MFFAKKFKIDRDLTVWIKPLTVIDFSGCDYVPLIYSSVQTEPAHNRKNQNSDDGKQGIREVLEKAIVKIKSKKVDKNKFIDICMENTTILEMIYSLIYTQSFKKKIIQHLL